MEEEEEYKESFINIKTYGNFWNTDIKWVSPLTKEELKEIFDNGTTIDTL